MKLYVLIENTALTPRFACEHGLSLLLETGGRRILFDTGASPAFAENAALLGVDLSTVDAAVLSHGHYDHGGGIARFLELNEHAPVCVSRRAFGEYHNALGAYIGLDRALRANKRLVPVEDELNIGEGLTVISCADMECVRPIDSTGLTELRGGEHHPDLFLHEQYLLVREGGRRILISGCSHRGVVNIMNRFSPDVFIGGFHFMKQEMTDGHSALLDDAAERLLSYPTTYYTGHCTGAAQYDYLSGRMGERLCALSSGLVAEI